jgi:hypothetical protein
MLLLLVGLTSYICLALGLFMLVMSFPLGDTTTRYTRKQKWVFYSALTFWCLFWPLSVVRYAFESKASKVC